MCLRGKGKWFGEPLANLFHCWLKSMYFIFIPIDKRMHISCFRITSEGSVWCPVPPTKPPRRCSALVEIHSTSFPRHTILLSPTTAVNLVTPGILDSLRPLCRCSVYCVTMAVAAGPRRARAHPGEREEGGLQLLFEFFSHENCTKEQMRTNSETSPAGAAGVRIYVDVGESSGGEA